MDDFATALSALLRHGNVSLYETLKPGPKRVACLVDTKNHDEDLGAIGDDAQTAVLYAWADLQMKQWLPF